jgi:hypothetical protein
MSRWPAYDPRRDGNVFQWIHEMAPIVRQQRQLERIGERVSFDHLRQYRKRLKDER